MKTAKVKLKTIDDYIATFPKEVQKGLEKLRRTIGKAVPQATEVISYGMPAFKFHGILVYFAAHKKHYGMYLPSSSAFKIFKKELAPYHVSKATLQFPYGKRIPLGLVRDMMKIKARENLEKAQSKKK